MSSKGKHQRIRGGGEESDGEEGNTGATRKRKDDTVEWVPDYIVGGQAFDKFSRFTLALVPLVTYVFSMIYVSQVRSSSWAFTRPEVFLGLTALEELLCVVGVSMMLSYYKHSTKVWDFKVSLGFGALIMFYTSLLFISVNAFSQFVFLIWQYGPGVMGELAQWNNAAYGGQTSFITTFYELIHGELSYIGLFIFLYAALQCKQRLSQDRTAGNTLTTAPEPGCLKDAVWRFCSFLTFSSS